MRKASITFIFITVLIDMIGIGLIIPSLPDVVRRFSSDPTTIASYYGYFISAYAAMQFLAAPLLGALSDMFGRRPILLNSLFIGGLDYILMAFAPSLTFLFVGRVISGLTGANVTVAMAYVADVTPPEKRAGAFGLMGAAFGIGFIVGPVIGGLVGQIGPEWPFIIAAAMNLLNFFFGLFVLPESLPTEKRRKFDLSKTNPFKTLVTSLKNKPLLFLLLGFFCLVLAGHTHPSIWTLFTQTKFNWTVAEVGYSLAAVGVMSAFSQAVLGPRLIPKLGEMRAVVIGVTGSMIGYVLFGLATEGWMMYVILIGSSIFNIATPALQSILSKVAPPNEQGELQGSLVSLQSLAAIANPLIVTQLFAHFNHPEYPGWMLGAPYFFAAVICLGSAIFMQLSRRQIAGLNL